jgi:hypothetical protein
MGSGDGISLRQEDTDEKSTGTLDEKRSRRSVKVILRFFMRLISKRAWFAGLLAEGKKLGYDFDQICLQLDAQKLSGVHDASRQAFVESLEPMREDIEFVREITKQHCISGEELLSVLNEFDSL